MLAISPMNQAVNPSTWTFKANPSAGTVRKVSTGAGPFTSVQPAA
ncbi:MAG: hypothetical protein M5U12_27385 [Verrucomicrobia bacterium]|nr:hypothetical protein [Verrucomicrobiota bacterium]